MATYKDILNEKENQNWLKGSLALRITKAGLRDLVEGDSYRVQQKIHSSIIQARKLAPGSSCSLCLTENLIRCPTKGLCSNPRNCKYHDSAFKMNKPCPSQICDDFRDEICAVHRYGGPSWKNTKADQWCINHWQVAKCFMPPDGYQDVSSFDETDFNGIISVMINCTEIQRSLSFNIANQPNQPNILTKARQIGRSIRHSPDLKVTDTDLADYFVTLNTLLTDSAYLASDSNAQQAVIKLKQLEKDTLPILSEDVRELLEEARAMIEAGRHELVQSVDTSKKEIQDVVSTGKSEIEEAVSEGKTAIANGKRDVEETVSGGKLAIETGKRQIEEVVSRGTTIIASVKREIEEKLSEGKTSAAIGKREIEEMVSEGKTSAAAGKREIEEKMTEALQRIRDVSCQSNAEREKDLQQRLAKYYHKQLNSAPISPLLSDKDERLDKFYVPPKIVEKDHKKVGAAEKVNATHVTSYRQMFCKTGQFRKNLFIVGEAGMGKSACAAMCALKWADQFLSTNTVNEPNKELLLRCNIILNRMFRLKTLDDQFQDDIFFKEIEFLFHLTLRNSCDLCDLTDMIGDQLINLIYQQDERAAALSTMHCVLSNNKCVIIVDGLDEWTHPNETHCSCSEEDKVIPYLSPTIDATVLITTRPWRMSQQRVKDTKIDTYMEIEGIADMMLLLQKIFNSLNEKVTDKKKVPDFITFSKHRKLRSLLSVPIILMLIACLWFEGMHESVSLCDIYAYTIEMMFGRKTLPVPMVSQKDIPFPQCFKHTENVQKYYSIVLELAQLAFTTLFSNDQTSALVFKNVDILAHANLLFALKSGILQETKTASLVKKSSSYSFIHKTVQEFLAAIYMSYNPEEFERVFQPFYQRNGHMADVSKVFLFMCGLNIKLANEMSALLLDRKLHYRFDISSRLQDMIVSGYKEAQASQESNILLSLDTFQYGLSQETEILNDLLAVNKSRVHNIRTSRKTCQATLQEVFRSSTDTLTKVFLVDVAGKYDLSTCTRIQDLSLVGSNLTDIVVNIKNLVSLNLSHVSERVENSIWQSLERESVNWQRLEIKCITHISLFCQTLPRLKHLTLLNISETDIGDRTLFLPTSVVIVILGKVTITARSLMELVERLENSTKIVQCKLWWCTVDPITEYEKIKRYIQTREMFDSEIKCKSSFHSESVYFKRKVGYKHTK